MVRAAARFAIVLQNFFGPKMRTVNICLFWIAVTIVLMAIFHVARATPHIP